MSTILHINKKLVYRKHPANRLTLELDIPLLSLTTSPFSLLRDALSLLLGYGLQVMRVGSLGRQN